MVVERSTQITGSSVRNFGHVGVGMHVGDARHYADLSRGIWMRLAEAAGFWLRESGSLMVSYARSRAEALGFQAKTGVMSRVERYVVLIIFLALELPQIALVILAAFTYFTFFQRMWAVWHQSREMSE